MNAPLELNERELLALAERAEAATGPDRRLDTLVEIARNPERPWIIGNKPGRFPQKPIYGTLADLWEWALDEAKEPPEIRAPHYTASLDSAMTLVPEGMEGGFQPIPNGLVMASMFQRCEGGIAMLKWKGIAATPALALTAAALRALATKATSHD